MFWRGSILHTIAGIPGSARPARRRDLTLSAPNERESQSAARLRAAPVLTFRSRFAPKTAQFKVVKARDLTLTPDFVPAKALFTFAFALRSMNSESEALAGAEACAQCEAVADLCKPVQRRTVDNIRPENFTATSTMPIAFYFTCPAIIFG
ncbi:hypothetical protein IT575_11440 [bacterium]|nr:hypothetical protein [bacterium]